MANPQDLITWQTILLIVSSLNLLKVIETRDSCRGRCASGYDRSSKCHCDNECIRYGECCEDYRTLCTSETSCSGRCFEQHERGRTCQCDPSCMNYGDCCSDFVANCGKDIRKNPAFVATTRASLVFTSSTRKPTAEKPEFISDTLLQQDAASFLDDNTKIKEESMKLKNGSAKVSERSTIINPKRFELGNHDFKISDQEMTTTSSFANTSKDSQTLDNGMTTPSVSKDGTLNSKILAKVMTTSVIPEDGTMDSKALENRITTHYIPEDRSTTTKTLNERIKTSTVPEAVTTNSKILYKEMTTLIPKDASSDSNTLHQAMTTSSMEVTAIESTISDAHTTMHSASEQTSSIPDKLDSGTITFPIPEDKSSNSNTLEEIATVPESNTLNSKIPNNGIKVPLVSENVSKSSEAQENKTMTPSLSADSTNSKIMQKGVTTSPIQQDVPTGTKILDKELTTNTDPEEITAGPRVLESVKPTSALPEAASTNARISDKRMASSSVPVGDTAASKLLHKIITSSPFPQASTSDSKILDNVVMTHSVPKDRTVDVKGLSTHFADKGSFTGSKILDRRMTTPSVFEGGNKYSKNLASKVTTYSASEGEFRNYNILDTAMPKNTFPEENSMGSNILDNRMSTSHVPIDASTNARMLYDGMTSFPAKIGEATYSEIPHQMFTTSPFPKDRITYSKILDQKLPTKFYEDTSFNLKKLDTEMTTSSENGIMASEVSYKRMATSPNPGEVTTNSRMLHKVMPWSKVPEYERSSSITVPQDEIVDFKDMDTGVTLHSVPEISSADPGNPSKGMITRSIPKVVTSESIILNKGITTTIPSRDSTDSKILNNKMTMLSITEDSSMIYKTLDNKMKTPSIPSDASMMSKILDKVGTTAFIPQDNSTEYRILEKGMKTDTIPEEMSIDSYIPNSGITILSVSLPNTEFLENGTTMLPAPTDQTMSSKPQLKVMTPSLFPEDGSTKSYISIEGLTTPPIPKDGVTDTGKTARLFPVDWITDSKVLAKKLGTLNISAVTSTFSKILDNAMTVPSPPEEGTNDSTILDNVLTTLTFLEGGTRDSTNSNKSTSTYSVPEDRFTYSKIMNKGIKIATTPGVVSTASNILNKGITPSHALEDDIPESVSSDKVITTASIVEVDSRQTRPSNTQIAYTALKETATAPSILDKGMTMFPAPEDMANDYKIMEKTTTIISQNNSMDLKILKNGTNIQSVSDNLSISLNKITTPSLPDYSKDSKVVDNGMTTPVLTTTMDSKMLMKIPAISAVIDDRMIDSKITNIMVSTSAIPENRTNDSKAVLTTLSIPQNGTRVTKELREGLTTPFANEGSSTDSKLLETGLTKTSVLQDGKMHSKILDNIMKTSDAFESGFADAKILAEGMKTTIVPENYSMDSEITSNVAKMSLITRTISISSNVTSTDSILEDGTTDSVFLEKGLPTVSNTDVVLTESKTSNTRIATFINPNEVSSVPSIFNKDMTTSTVSEERTNNSKFPGNKTAANISENESMDSNVQNHRLTMPSVAEDIHTSSKILYDKMGNSSIPVDVTTEFNSLDEIMTTVFISQVTSREANLLEAEMTTQTNLEQASSKLVIGRITPSVPILASTNSNTLDNRTVISSVPESKMTNLKAFHQIMTQSSFPKNTSMPKSTETPPIVTDASTKAEASANAKTVLSFPDGETMLSKTLDKGITTTASLISQGEITHSKILNKITSTDTIPEMNTTDYSFLDKRMTEAFTTEVASIEPTHSDRQVTTPTVLEEASPVPTTLEKRMTAFPVPEHQTNDSKLPDKVATTFAPADSSVDTKLWKKGHTMLSITEDISTDFKISNKMTDSSLPVDVTTDSTTLGKTTTMAFFREDAKMESKISETRLTTQNNFVKASGSSITLISGMTDPSISTKSPTDSQILDNRIITSSVPEGEATDPIMTAHLKTANTASTFPTKRTTTPTDPEDRFLNSKILDKEITTSLPNTGTMNKGITKIPFTEDITGYNTLSKMLSTIVDTGNASNDSKILDSVLTAPSVLDNGTMDSRFLDKKIITTVPENGSEVMDKIIAVSPVLQDTIMSSKVPYKIISAVTIPENGTMDSLLEGSEITKAFMTEGAFIQLKTLDRENATQILPEEISLNPSKLEKGIESLSGPEVSTSSSKIQYKLATTEDDSIDSENQNKGTRVPLVTEGVSMNSQISDNKMSISSVPADGNTDFKILDTTVATVFITEDISTEPKILVHAVTDSSVTEDGTTDFIILNKGITTVPNDDCTDQKILDEGVTTLPVSLSSIADSKIQSEITSTNSDILGNKLATSTVDGDVSEVFDNEKTIQSVLDDATMDSKTIDERITTIVLQENSTRSKILNNQPTVPSVHKDASADSMVSDKGKASTTAPVHEFTDPKIMPAGITNFVVPEEPRIDLMSGMSQNGTIDSQIMDKRKVVSSTKIYISTRYETLAKEMTTTVGTSTDSRFLSNGTATHPESEYRNTESKILGKGMTASSINKRSSTDSKASNKGVTAHTIPIAFSKTKFLDIGTVKYTVTGYRTMESKVGNKGGGGGTIPEDGPKTSKLLHNERITSPTLENSILHLNSFHTAEQIQPTIPQETSSIGSNLNKRGILQSIVPSHLVASDPILKTVEMAQVNILQNPVTVEPVNLNIGVKISKEELFATNSKLKRENIKPNVPVKYKVPIPTRSDNMVTEPTHERRNQITGKTQPYEDTLNDSNLCNKKPSDAMTTLQNGTTYIFRGHLFWAISQKGQMLGHPHRISDVWGIPSPIDTIFTRCNCLGNTYFFKGDQYWRFQNGHMDSGYPRRIAAGFSGLSGEITAALSVAAYRNRPEMVYFFKKGGLYQKYVYQTTITSCPQERTHSHTYQVAGRYRRQTMVAIQKSRKLENAAQISVEMSIRKNWHGFPLTVTSAISLPNPGLPEKYEYYVLSRAKSYKVDPVNQKATYMKRSITKDLYKCF